MECLALIHQILFSVLLLAKQITSWALLLILILKQNIHIAWDLPQLDLTERLKEMVKYVKPYKITCYVLIGFNSTIEQDLFRLNVLRELGITPFVIPFRDYGNERTPTRYERDLARWANRMWLFKSTSFENYAPRKGFKGIQVWGISEINR